MNGDVVEKASIAFSNITNKLSNKAISNERNLFREEIDKIDGMKRILEIFEFLNTQKDQNEQERNVINRLSLTISEYSNAEKYYP
jgi:hypothetical protein